MSVDRQLSTPDPGRWAAEAFVAEYLSHLTERRRPSSESPSSSVVRGGQHAADAALARFSIAGYGRGMNSAYPQPRRTVSRLSPWIRHGLLPLPRMWALALAAGSHDGELFRAALLRQEYARHWYARLGHLTRNIGDRQYRQDSGRRAGDGQRSETIADGWDRRLGCLELTLDELEEDGWIPDSARQWLAGHRVVREGQTWRPGEEFFHQHLLDGSRAAGRLGWLRISGVGEKAPFAPSRWEVEQHAPGLCASCELVRDCPIEHPPESVEELPVWQHPLLLGDPDPDRTGGPDRATTIGEPEVVWLTAESLGDADPALAAHPDLPVVFVFDERLLISLRLSSTRFSFLVETLSDLATRRRVELWLGDPTTVLAGRAPAVTFTPVPGWRRRAAQLDLAVVHPWAWVFRPRDSRIDSFGCWIDGISSTMEEATGRLAPRGKMPTDSAGRSNTELV